MTAALRTTIRLSRVPFREVERQLGLGTGYLSRILSGKAQLRLRSFLGEI